MNELKLKLESPWEEVKEKLKEANAELTDEELEYEPGKESELLERISTIILKDIDWVKPWVQSVSYTRGIRS